MLHTRRMGTAGDIRAAAKYTRKAEQVDFGCLIVLEVDLDLIHSDGHQFLSVARKIAPMIVCLAICLGL